MKNYLLTLFFLSVLAMNTAWGQNQMPPFSFFTLSGEVFSHEQIKKGVPTIVLYFDPYCDHCAQQATWISEAKEAFKDIQMVWVTTELEVAASQNFAKKYFKDPAWQEVHFLIDKDFMFDGYFGYSEVPSIYLYNAAGQRVKGFTKETPASVLLRFL